jgi:hypothetical protein
VASWLVGALMHEPRAIHHKGLPPQGLTQSERITTWETLDGHPKIMSDSETETHTYSEPKSSLPWTRHSIGNLDDLGLMEHRLPVLEDWHDLLDADDVVSTDDAWSGNYKCCGLELRDIHELVLHFEGHFMPGADLNKLAELATERGMSVAALGRKLAKRSGTGDSADFNIDNNLAYVFIPAGRLTC